MGKGLFKEMLYALGPLMRNCKTNCYVQTFLSETASQRVTNNSKPAEYSFKFAKCPQINYRDF